QLARLAMLQLWVTAKHVEVSTHIGPPMMSIVPSEVRALDVGDGDCRLGLDELDSLRPLGEKLCELSGAAIPILLGVDESLTWAEGVEVLGKASIEGICDGGIAILGETQPRNCDAPTPVFEVVRLLDH